MTPDDPTTPQSPGAGPSSPVSPGAGSHLPATPPAAPTGAEAGSGIAGGAAPGDAAAGQPEAVTAPAGTEARDVPPTNAAAGQSPAGDGPAGPGYGSPGYGSPGYGGVPPAGGAPGPGGTAGPGPGAWQRRRLTRSRRSRMIAGVAGGLGEYAGVDPVLLRVLFAVLALPIFGWTGLLLYLVCWLLLPDEDESPSPAQSLLGRGGRNTGASVEGVLLGVAAALLGALLIRGDIGDGGDVVLLALIIGGALLLNRNMRRNQPPPGATPGMPGPPPAAAYGTPSYSTASYPTTGFPAPGYPTGDPKTAQFTAPGGQFGATTGMPAAPTTPAPGVPGAPDLGVTTALPPYAYIPPPPPPARPRSPLGWLTLSATVLALGVLGVLDGTGSRYVPFRAYFAVALAVIGAGLLVGTVFGRARRLIWLGLPLTVATIVASSLGGMLHGGVGDREYTPATPADIAARYETGAGTLTLDMSDVDFVDHSVATDLRLGIGDIRITVPDNVDVTVRAHTGLGTLRLFGTAYDGARTTQHITDEGPDGAGGGTLTLTLNAGLGDVEVDRA